MSGTGHEVDMLIVGGGIGGLAAALALARRGRAVHVLEQAPAFTEIGAGLQLAPNALRVLDDLDVLDEVLATAVTPARVLLRSAVTGAELAELGFGDSFRAAYGYPYVVTHRSDLLDVLLARCRASDLITLEVSRRVVEVREDIDGVAVACDDGIRYRARALVGADGMWSVVRGTVVGDGEPRYIGDVAYRGTLPLAEAERSGERPNVTWWIGPGIHLIQYPIRRSELLNQVAVFVSAREGSPEDWGPPAELERMFAGTTDFVRRSIERIDRSRRWVLRDRAPVTGWTSGATTLLGDAAHPMAQYLAQGACQALEDASELAEQVAFHEGVADAFRAYEAERGPRTGRLQTWARRMGDIVHADGTTAMLRDAFLADHPAAELSQVQWLYGYRAGRATAGAAAAEGGRA